VLDTRRLRVLREVARRGSLTAAAEVLSYTPSAISQQIAALEREAGTALLERRARGVVLTEAGQVLVGHAEHILSRLATAEVALADLAELRRGRLRIASVATAGARVLPRAIDVFHRRYPEIELTAVSASPSAGIAGLREGRLDVAMTEDGPRRQRVSGVLVGREFGMHTVGRRWPELWVNPWAEHAVKTSLFDLPLALPRADGTVAYVEPDGTPGQLLGLAPDWPGPERPFEKR
jgi:DNA-binding transcriptional LysR family regulator